jgi:hypothetical protein
LSQHDLSIANQGFPAFRSDLNDALQALGSMQSGTTAPSTTYANQLWYDTTNNIVKMRNEDNDAWISLFTLDQSADEIASVLVGSGSASAPSIADVADTNTGIYFPAANKVGITTDGTERVIVDSSGNVGIGTSSPANILDVQSASPIVKATATTGTSGVTFRVANTGGISYFGRDSSAGGFGAAYSTVLWGTGAYPLLFGTNDAERMRIDSSGNLLVNTTSATASAKFVVAADTTTANPMTVSNTRSTAATDYSILFYRNASLVGSVQTSLSATSYVTSSDYRLKENVSPMTGALNKVAQLKPCTYTWKLDGSDGQGFIAHELQAVVPDCVTGEKDAVDADGNPVYQGIDTSFLVATLTAAIQEQQAIIEQLKADVEALKAA